jgi:Methyltransferase domain
MVNQIICRSVTDYAPDPALFQQFKTKAWFPSNYHGGEAGGVWDEKLLEHWVAGDLLGLWHWGQDDIYVDIAACNSPWAQCLRERLGLSTFAIDLEPVGSSYRDLPYYRSENATQTTFKDSSITGASLQCAYEMFQGQDDQRLIVELARILRPGGKVVILPLYMHTHYCAYSTPEYYGKGYQDPGAKEYIRIDCYGVPSSRKYDALRLKERVLDQILKAGLHYRLLALRNKEALSQEIYCHFILEIEK